MSARPVFLALLLLCTFESSLASGRGPWSAGWGFAETGGIPLQPPGLQSYMLNRSVMGLFVANNTGLASPKELAAELTLGTIGIGWNLDHLHTSQDPQDPAGSLGGGIEGLELQQAAALKQARPEVGVMVLRNTEVISVFWTAGKKAMQNPDLWLQCPPGSGKPCAEQWGTDDPRSGPTTLKYFLNFSNPDTQAWWLNEYVAPALSHPEIDGVYTDCSCGTARGETFTSAEAAGRLKAFSAARELAASKGKWFSTWVVVPQQPPGIDARNCDDTMKRAVQIGVNGTQTLQWYAGSQEISKETLAAFLIARGPSATMFLAPYDAPMIARQWSFPTGVDANADPGTPTGQAQLNGQVWQREYTKASVVLDCAAFKATITFK